MSSGRLFHSFIAVNCHNVLEMVSCLVPCPLHACLRSFLSDGIHSQRYETYSWQGTTTSYNLLCRVTALSVLRDRRRAKK